MPCDCAAHPSTAIKRTEIFKEKLVIFSNSFILKLLEQTRAHMGMREWNRACFSLTNTARSPNRHFVNGLMAASLEYNMASERESVEFSVVNKLFIVADHVPLQ